MDSLTSPNPDTLLFWQFHSQIGIYICLVLVGLSEPLGVSLLHRQAIKRLCPQATPLLTRCKRLSFFCEASNPQPFTNGAPLGQGRTWRIGR